MLVSPNSLSGVKAEGTNRYLVSGKTFPVNDVPGMGPALAADVAKKPAYF